MRRPRFTVVALALALALTAACGGGGDGNGAGQGDDQGEQLANLQGQSVEVAAVWSGDEQANFTEVLNAFSQRTGATATFTSTGDDIATVVGTRLQGGNPPDVAILPQPGLLTDFARRNALKPVQDVAGTAVNNNYAPVWRTLGTVDNTLYGVWFKAANKSLVWYRTQAFRDAGVEPPESWEEFVRVSRTLADAGTTPISLGGGDGWVLTDWFENLYLRSAGPDNYDRLSRRELPWTDESVKRALRMLGEVWGQPNLLVGGNQGALATQFADSVTQAFADPPKGAIVVEGDFVAGEITANTRAQLGRDADFFPFPAVGTSGPAVVAGGDVAVMMKDTPAARELMKFLASPAAAEVWARKGGFISPNNKVEPDAYPDEILGRAAQELLEARAVRFDLSDLQPAAFGATIGQGMWKILQDFLANPSNVDGTAAALEQAARAAHGR